MYEASSAGFLTRMPERPYAEAMVGELVGPYRIRRLIGQGGMGVVYEAEDERVRGRRVAVKLLTESLGSRRAQVRFELETEALGRIRHPNVAALYDAGWRERPAAAPQAYLAMELVDGQPITSYVRRRSPTIHERAALFRQVCQAVGHTHALGVIHRDLKPSNVLVTKDGHVKVLDFGVARITAGEGMVDRTRATQTGEIVGTLPYMSPEQVSGGDRPVDTRSDVYSLGVMLYELLAGRRPYEVKASSLLAAARTIRDATPLRLGGLDPALGGDLETIVGHALEKDPARRYMNASELGEDLRRWLEHEPIAARAPSLAYRLRRFIRRNRPLVASVLAISVALISASIISSVMALRAERDRAVAERRYEQVRGIARAMMFDVHDAVEQLPGSLEARRLILEQAIEYLNTMDNDVGNDAALEKDLAAGYIRVGEALDDWSGPAFHDYTTASRVYRRVIELLDGPEHSGDAEALKLLAKAHRQLNRTTPKSADSMLKESARHYYIALDIIERASDIAPEDLECRIIRIDTLRLLAGCKLKRSPLKFDAALPSIEQAIADAESLLRESPESLALRHLAARTHSMLISICFQGPRLPERMLRSAERIDELLRIDDPATAPTVAVSMCARTAAGRALALSSLERFDEMESAVERGESLAQYLIERDQHDATAVRAMATLAYIRGRSHESRGRDEGRTRTDRAEHWRLAIEAYKRYQEMHQYREASGLLPEWESHYPEMAAEYVKKAERELAALRQDTEPSGLPGS